MKQYYQGNWCEMTVNFYSITLTITITACFVTQNGNTSNTAEFYNSFFFTLENVSTDSIVDPWDQFYKTSL